MTCGDAIITVESDRVKSLPALEPSSSAEVFVVESGYLIDGVLWDHPDQRLTGLALGRQRRHGAPTLTGMAV